MGEQVELFTRISWFRPGGVDGSRSISNFSLHPLLPTYFLTGVES